MPDNDAILGGLLTPTKYATPEQRRRAQQHAYALMQQPDEKYTNWTQGARDVVNALVGRHIINQTNSQEAEQLNQGGQSQASLLDEIQRRAKLQSAPSPQASAAPTPPITTGSLAPDNGAAAQNVNNPIAPDNSIEAPKGGYKLDQYLKRLFEVESGNNPEAKKGSYRGLAQFSPDLEKKYGINEDNWKDPTTQIRAAAQHTVESAQAYKERFGHEPTNGELYLMHQQGVNGGTSILGGEPNAPAWKTIKEAAKVSDEEAKRRITGNIPTGSSLSKKPVDQITNQEFGRLWTGKFDSEQSNYKPMMLGGPKESDTAPPGPRGQQVAQANGIPPAVSAPSAAVDKDNLAKLLANPTIPDAMKSKIQEMMIQGATPAARETAIGTEQYRPSNPSETSTPGAAGFSPFSIGDIHTVQRTVVGPDGKPETMVMIPNGKGQWTSMEGMKAWIRDQHAQDTFTSENTKRLGEDYSKYQQLGNSASEQVQNLDLMKQTLNDPNMYVGTGDQKVLDWKKFLVSIGKDPNDKAAPAEVFKKLMAGGVLEGLGQFKGLGQIRVAEIDQLQKSLADTNMTKPAIMAVLNLNQRAHERHVEIANEASKYASVHNDRLDTGWDAHLREWKKEHPFMTKDDIKNWKEEFAGKTAATTPTEVPKSEGKRVYNPATRKWE